MKKLITFISDTHNKHKHLTSKGMGNILGSGDILVHAGDCTSMGYTHEIEQFLEWFSETDFKYKIFIAGNHDFGFEQQTDIPQVYKDMGVIYLFDMRYRDWETDRTSTRLNSSHSAKSRMPSSA